MRKGTAYSCTCTVTSNGPRRNDGAADEHCAGVVSDLLEPCAGKLARTVLRGGKGREALPLPDNRRTADGGRLFSFRGVTTGLLLTQPLLAASGTFADGCQPGAAPNTYPRVSHRIIQHDATTAGGRPAP